MTIGVLVIIMLTGGVLAGLIAANRGVSSPGAYFFIGLLLPLIGVVVACVAKPEVHVPAGTRAMDCPRCNAHQNVPLEAMSWQCWQCGLPGHVEAV